MQQPHYPSIQERTSILEDTFEKFMQASISNQKNIKASIRNLKTQVGQLDHNQGSNFQPIHKPILRSIASLSQPKVGNLQEKELGKNYLLRRRF